MLQITSRISLEKLTMVHASLLYEVIAESRESLKNLVWAESATLESTMDFIQHQRGVRNVILVNGKIAGMIETWSPDEDGFVTIGYWLGREYRGYGIMQLVVRWMADAIVENAPLKAKVRNANEKSFKILKGAGLVVYGRTESWTYLMRPQQGV